MAAEQAFHIWEGVYGEWNEALPVGDAFNNDKWLGEQAAHVGAEFADRDNLFFHSEMPPADMRFDIVHVGRSMQYVDDWRGLLAAFVQRKEQYIALAGLLAGDIKPFVTMQNYYGCKIPVRFLNRDEVIRAVEDLGYRLIYKALHFSKRLGREGPLPMENFPAENRLEHPCQLLFQKKSA